MITSAYAQTMAAYNAEMNGRLYAAAGRLSDAARRQNRGAFWRSIHGTLSHLLWGDEAWMSRFDGWTKPTTALEASGEAFPDFADMAARRQATDEKITAWTHGLTTAWLGEDQTWFSGAAGREMRAPRALLVAHFFNHQTHHRGQVHAMLTAAGETTGATDLLLVLA